jgi:hypothetical protein
VQAFRSNLTAVLSSVLALVAIAAFWPSTASPSVDDSETKVKNEIIRLERQQWDAFKKKDRTALAPILAEGYFDFGSDGREDRTFSLTKGYMSDEQDLSEFIIDDAQVKVLDDHTALLTYRGTYRGTVHGRPNSGSGFYSDLYQKQNGKWLSVFTQDSNLKCAGL